MIPDKEIFLKPVKLRENYIKTHFSELWDLIKDLPPKKLSEKLYWYYCNLNDYPKCPVCGKSTKFITLFKGYQTYCSATCCAIDPNRIKKSKDTILKRYGVTHIAQNEEIKLKIKNTNIKKHGGIGFASDEILKKFKQTMINKYGVENATQNNEIKDKIFKKLIQKWGSIEEYYKYQKNKTEQTCLKKYGVKSSLCVPSIRQKIKQTCLDHYGVDKYINPEKIKQTCLERYGVDNPMKLKEFQDKSKQTCLERYGVEYAILNKDVRKKNEKSRMQFYIDKHDLLGIDDDGKWICKCPHKECDLCDQKYYKINSSQFYARLSNNIEPCTNLLKINPSSNTYIETFVKNILNKNNIIYETNVRNIISPKELDIYIPSKNIAIECNGCYWHSSEEKSNRYHIDKYKECKEKGIQLISIWEDQIITKPEIIESIILSKLGIYQKRIYARKCIIKEIDSKTCNNFLTYNHLYDKTNSSVKLGIYHSNEIIGVMTFLKTSKGCNVKKWDLTRFCTKLNTQIIGAANKLLKFFIKKYRPSQIVSFSTNDISNGNLYKNLGFQSLNDNKIDLNYWFISKKTYIRYYNMPITSDVLKNEKYLKIYDSGRVKYTLNV